MCMWTRSTLVQVMVCHLSIIWTNADLLPIRPSGTNQWNHYEITNILKNTIAKCHPQNLSFCSGMNLFMDFLMIFCIWKIWTIFRVYRCTMIPQQTTDIKCLWHVYLIIKEYKRFWQMTLTLTKDIYLIYTSWLITPHINYWLLHIMA